MSIANIGPVLMEVVGDEFVEPTRIGGIIWEGATSSGDTVALHCRQTGILLWFGRTPETQTYLGATGISKEGIHCPFGFRLTQISNGRLLVYLNEN